MARLLSLVVAVSAVLLGCGRQGEEANGSKVLVMPERVATSYITDQMQVAGQDLVLWFEDTGCQLQVVVKGKEQGDKRWLKPTAPCYFIQSPGTAQAQVYEHDKNTRILVVVGTPVPSKKPDSRCGRELQGLIIDAAGRVQASNHVRSGSIYCTDQGLDNFQYPLFMHE